MIKYIIIYSINAIISMQHIPIETRKLIALYLKPGIMTTVCKAFDIYDEVWYHNYLLMRYDEAAIMNRTFSFKELCRDRYQKVYYIFIMKI